MIGLFIFIAMAVPFFYIEESPVSESQLVLDEATSRHIVQVLRMKQGEAVNLTDGRGLLISSRITSDHKKRCEVKVEGVEHVLPGEKKVVIAISLIKNRNRLEWFLEKATEIGVHGIVPLYCERTEKEKFRLDRWKGICVSAMLQSQQCWLPLLYEAVSFKDWIAKPFDGRKFIAHCVGSEKHPLADYLQQSEKNSQILIGPEGDFTENEISMALENNFLPVALGPTRLRTETAAVVAAALLCHI